MFLSGRGFPPFQCCSVLSVYFSFVSQSLYVPKNKISQNLFDFVFGGNLPSEWFDFFPRLMIRNRKFSGTKLLHI